MPSRTRLIRRGRAPARGAGGARSRAGGRPRSCASSTRVPCASAHRLATASTSQCRATRAGSVRRERCHCQPTALERPEAELDPGPQRVPAHPDPVGRQVGDHHPGLLLRCRPGRDQGDRQPPALRPAEPTAADPGLAGADQGPGRAALPTVGDDRGPPLDAQRRVPAEPADAPPQPRAPQAAVGQHQHRPARRHGRAQAAQQAQDRPHPRARRVAGQDRPGDRDGAAAVEHAHDQRHHVLAVRGGVDRQRQLAPLPPGEHPAQQGRETALDVDLRGAGHRLVRPVQEPLPQALA